jgi:hypothetical protein
VEVGACDGKWCSQTWNLLACRGWSGIVIEKDAEEFARLEQTFKQQPQVRCIRAEVTGKGPDSLDELLAAHTAPADIGFLSIDIEGNDYHIWESLSRHKPTVLAIDFNPTISNDIAYVQAYDATSPFGASLRALVALGKRKGYRLAAATDWNAIFVTEERFPELGILSNHIDDMYYAPFEMRMTQTMDGWLHLLAGARLVRQDYDILFEDFQVLPSNLRGQDSSMGGFGRTPTLFYGWPPRRDLP